jgi:polyphenol oxidase
MQTHNEVITPDWKNKFNDIVCGFTLPVMGNQALTRKSRTNGHTTEENRVKLAKFLGIKENTLFSPHQVHSDEIIHVTEDMKGMGALNISNAKPGDACLTSISNVLLITTWADCIPVLIYDPVEKIAGTVHSGWRGAKLNIAGKTIKEFEDRKSLTHNIYAAVGPGIRACCYKIGEEVRQSFDQEKFGRYFISKEDGIYMDLAGIVSKQLIDAGISPEKIDKYGKCNSCSKDPVFFSCRKDGKDFEGQAAFIGILN